MRFILELRVAAANDPAPVVQEWILDTDVTQVVRWGSENPHSADFVVPFAASKSGGLGALGDFVEQINRAVGMFTDPCNALVPEMGQSLCTRQYGHAGPHRCSLADVQARAR